MNKQTIFFFMASAFALLMIKKIFFGNYALTINISFGERKDKE